MTTFRKRFVGIILATDTEHHSSMLAHYGKLLEEKATLAADSEVASAADENRCSLVRKMIDKTDATREFKTKQQLLELCIHAADVSSPLRPFEVTREWTYLLFEEFFLQGDLEKEQELPVSFLCDRKTTSVPKTQPGFLNFIVMPLYETVAKILPEIETMVE